MNVPPTRSYARPILVNLEPYLIEGQVVDFDPAGGSSLASGWGRLLLREDGGESVTEYAYPLSVPIRVGSRVSGTLASADDTYALSELEIVASEIEAAQPSFPVPSFDEAASAILRITAPPRSSRVRAIAAFGEQLELIA